MPHVPDTGPLRMLTAHEVAARGGHKIAKLYADIQVALLPPPIRRGKKFSRWPEHEIDAILRARISGADDHAVRALVGRLVALRERAAHG